MSFFARVFRGKDSSAAKKQAKQNAPDANAPSKPQWTDAYLRTEVAPEEVQELLRGCTQELKTRGSSSFLFTLLSHGNRMADEWVLSCSS
jgi:hypothetical protein